jgi:hypothetical protein
MNPTCAAFQWWKTLSYFYAPNRLDELFLFAVWHALVKLEVASWLQSGYKRLNLR